MISPVSRLRQTPMSCVGFGTAPINVQTLQAGIGIDRQKVGYGGTMLKLSN